MEDIIKSIKAHLYDRATSPLSGSFVVSWIGWNYKFVVTLLSSMDAHEKFEYISTFLYATPYDCYLVGIIFPLLTTLAYIFLYPYIGNRVYGFSRGMKKDLMERKIKADKEEPISAEKAKQLYRDMDELRYEHEEDLERRNAENNRLKGRVESQEKTINDHRETIESNKEATASHEKNAVELVATIGHLKNDLEDKTTILSDGPSDDMVLVSDMENFLDKRQKAESESELEPSIAPDYSNFGAELTNEEKKTNEIRKAQLQVLEHFCTVDERSEGFLCNRSSGSRAATLFYLGDMVNQGLLIKNTSDDSYEITHAGRGALVSNNLCK